jgi:hypothetical protein
MRHPVLAKGATMRGAVLAAPSLDGARVSEVAFRNPRIDILLHAGDGSSERDDDRCCDQPFVAFLAAFTARFSFSDFSDFFFVSFLPCWLLAMVASVGTVD